MTLKRLLAMCGFLTTMSGIIAANNQNYNASNIKRLKEEPGYTNDEGKDLGSRVHLPRNYQKYELNQHTYNSNIHNTINTHKYTY